MLETFSTRSEHGAGPKGGRFWYDPARMGNVAYGYALLTCDATVRDPNGKTTLYGIFDRIGAAKFPAAHPMFSIYWKCLAPGPGRVGVAVFRPDGSQLTELEPVETSREGPHVIQGTYALGAFQFPVPGAYAIVLIYNGSEVLRTSLNLAEAKTTR